MAASSCVKCGHTQFEITESSPRGWTHRVAYLQCMKCGGVAGVMPVFDAGVTGLQIKAELSTLATKIDDIQHKVHSISSRLR